MASDYLLELDGIKGESQDKAHPWAINIDAFSWGASNAGAGGGAGLGAGKVVPQAFHFIKRTDKASPLLFLACASGQHIKKATLFVSRTVGDTKHDFYTIQMSDVLVESFQSSGAGELPNDNLSFVFAGIQLSIATVNADGSLGTPVTAGWNLGTNKKA